MNQTLPHESSTPGGPLALQAPRAVLLTRNGGIAENARGTAHLLSDLAALGRVTTAAALPLLDVSLDELDAATRTADDVGDNGGGETLGAAARAALRANPPPFAPRGEIDHLTCLVADDHPVVREAISNVLERQGIEVVARVSDGDAALAEILGRRPVAALVDLKLPPPDGLAIARETSRVAPETAVILYTGADPTLLSNALDCGARGFMLKEAPVADIARAVKMVSQGHLYFDPALASFLVASPAAQALGSRELEILRLLADGCTYEAIGKHLFLSPETVRTQVRALQRKLNVRTRTEAVATALRDQLIA